MWILHRLLLFTHQCSVFSYNIFSLFCAYLVLIIIFCNNYNKLVGFSLMYSFDLKKQLSHFPLLHFISLQLVAHKEHLLRTDSDTTVWSLRNWKSYTDLFIQHRFSNTASDLINKSWISKQQIRFKAIIIKWATAHTNWNRCNN